NDQWRDTYSSSASRAENSCGVRAPDPVEMFSSGKFTPLPLDRYFNASSKQFGPRERARQSLQASSEDGLIRTPSGQCRELNEAAAVSRYYARFRRFKHKKQVSTGSRKTKFLVVQQLWFR